jgi:hypothetical protein
LQNQAVRICKNGFEDPSHILWGKYVDAYNSSNVNLKNAWKGWRCRIHTEVDALSDSCTFTVSDYDRSIFEISTHALPLAAPSSNGWPRSLTGGMLAQETELELRDEPTNVQTVCKNINTANKRHRCIRSDYADEAKVRGKLTYTK